MSGSSNDPARGSPVMEPKHWVKGSHWNVTHLAYTFFQVDSPDKVLDASEYIRSEHMIGR